MTQTEKILRHIEEYGSITPIEALQEYGIMRLASRMCDIKRAGYPVHKVTETAKNRYGEPVRYARYTIPVATRRATHENMDRGRNARTC